MSKQITEAAAAMSGIVDQAFQTLGDSVKVTMKAQEDTLRFLGDFVGKNGIPNVAAEIVPVAQKNTDEYLRLMETSYRRNAELLKKAIGSQREGETPNLQNGIEFFEASMAVAHENTRDLADANLRVANSWANMLKKSAAKVADAR